MERKQNWKAILKKSLAMLTVFCMLLSGTLMNAGTVFGASAAQAEQTAMTFKKLDAPKLIVVGKGAPKGNGFTRNFKYLTQSQLKEIKDESSARKYFASEKNATYLKDKKYSAMTKKSQGGWSQQTISGLNLAAVADSLGIDTSKAVTVNAKGSDGHTSSLYGAFTEKRYTFPSESADQEQGVAVLPAVALTGTSQPSELPRLVFGQTEAGDFNMQNWEKWLKYLWFGDKEYILSLNVNGQTKRFTLADVIGTKSGRYTADYKYNDGTKQVTTSATGIPLDKFLADAGVTGNYTIKTSSGKTVSNPSQYMLAYEATQGGTAVYSSGQLVLYGPGTTKSSVVTEGVKGFTLTVSAPAAVTGVKAVKNSYNSIKLTWSKTSGAQGYNIYRYNSKKKTYSLLDCTEGASKTSYIDRGLKTGTKYTYKVRAYKTLSNLDLEGTYSKAVSAAPSLNKTSVKLSKSGKKSMKVRWSKVSGASGYQLRVGTNKKITKGKKTYTIKKGSTVSKTVTKLKKGKRYYVKVRAYRTVSGKKVYGAYSAVRSIKR